MIIDDLDLVRVAVFPPEANTPLIVDPDRVLAPPASLQGLQPKARRLEVAERPDLVEKYEPPKRCSLKRLESCDVLPMEKPLGFLRFEGPNHTNIILRRAYDVKRITLEHSR